MNHARLWDGGQAAVDRLLGDVRGTGKMGAAAAEIISLLIEREPSVRLTANALVSELKMGSGGGQQQAERRDVQV